ncbi:DNA-binding transcriptional LysR family regulator [Nakamurella sp. UYEF19]|uniref:LysR family transcriptional regulator n=1 Tax=Nakamurella sp. UYEF19 TaxID=1756392 RepID=UPI00339ADDB2
MTLNQLRAFLSAARTGSFTAAAAELSVAQASVSELIRRLEDELGLPLFGRGGRRLVVTPAGVELLSYAEQAVAAADGGAQAIRNMQTLGGGVATFGLLRNADFYLLSDLVEQFLVRHPSVRVRMVGVNSVETAGAVAAGELEAGLVVLPIDDEGLTVTPLLRDEVFYASRNPDHVSGPVTIERFCSARLVLYDAHYGWKDPTRRQLLERAHLAGLKIEPWIEVEHVESALDLVMRGVGDSIVCQAVVESSACPPGLLIAPFAEPLYDTIALIQRVNAVLSPATREFARLAERTLMSRQQRPTPP